MMDLSKEIYRLSTDPILQDHYCDIKLIVNETKSFMTSKLAVYLMYPFLGNSLSAADCLILTENHSQHFDSGESGMALLSKLEETSEVNQENQNRAVLLDQIPDQLPEETSISSYICSFCLSKFSSYKKFRQHVSDRHKHCFQCPDCSSTFANRGDLRKHQVKHTSEKLHECPICGVKVKHSRNLSRHLSRHAKKLQV